MEDNILISSLLRERDSDGQRRLREIGEIINQLIVMFN